jgi:hypothetical protein
MATSDVVRTTEVVLAAARAVGSHSVLLTGSAARRTRGVLSDIDYCIVGARPSVRLLPSNVDIFAVTPLRMLTRLSEGDDYAHWVMKFGEIVSDDGTFSRIRSVCQSAGWRVIPDRKLTHARRSVARAHRLVETGDAEAAADEVRSMLTIVARWSVLNVGEIPLSSPEVVVQLKSLGDERLALLLSAALGGTCDDLEGAIEVARSRVGAAV